MKNKKKNAGMPVLTWNGHPWTGSCTVQTTAPPTERTGNTRLTVRNAIVYATRVRRDKLLSSVYLSFCRRRKTVYQTAKMDYEYGPVVHWINLEGDTVLHGITVSASDNVQVNEVMIITADAAGKQLESALAVYNEEAGAWEYTLRCKGTVGVQVIATDIPGNKTTVKIQFD